MPPNIARRATAFLDKFLVRVARVQPCQLSRERWGQSLHDPTGFYRDTDRYFHQHLDRRIRQHRRFFARRRMGYGEDAHHTMWYLLMREFRFRSFLEIGVFCGQTLSLLALLQSLHSIPEDVAGVSPFDSSGDSVSNYSVSVDFYHLTLSNFDFFGLKTPTLLRQRSESVSAREFVKSRLWDAIYIDGNHDEQAVRGDWEACSQAVRPGGLVVFDDASLFTGFRPPKFASAGHPGPSRVADSLAGSGFKEILRVGHNRVFQNAG